MPKTLGVSKNVPHRIVVELRHYPFQYFLAIATLAALVALGVRTVAPEHAASGDRAQALATSKPVSLTLGPGEILVGTHKLSGATARAYKAPRAVRARFVAYVARGCSLKMNAAWCGCFAAKIADMEGIRTLADANLAGQHMKRSYEDGTFTRRYRRPAIACARKVGVNVDS